MLPHTCQTCRWFHVRMYMHYTEYVCRSDQAEGTWPQDMDNDCPQYEVAKELVS